MLAMELAVAVDPPPFQFRVGTCRDTAQTRGLTGCESSTLVPPAETGGGGAGADTPTQQSDWLHAIDEHTVVGLTREVPH